MMNKENFEKELKKIVRNYEEISDNKDKQYLNFAIDNALYRKIIKDKTNLFNDLLKDLRSLIQKSNHDETSREPFDWAKKN